MSPDERYEQLAKMTVALGEFFDAVQIHASYINEQGQTIGMNCGVGNFYARQGMASEFLSEEDARVCERTIRKEFDGEG